MCLINSVQWNGLSNILTVINTYLCGNLWCRYCGRRTWREGFLPTDRWRCCRSVLVGSIRHTHHCHWSFGTTVTICQLRQSIRILHRVDEVKKSNIKKVKGKGVYSCLWKSISQLRSVTCRMGSHSVTFHPTQANTPRLHPSQTGWYSIYRPFKDSGLSKPRPRVQRATGLRLLRDSPGQRDPNPRPSDRRVKISITHAWNFLRFFIFLD